jgi:multimeric flavodoxin WrbA
MIKILGLAGSPRQSGNTALLLQETLRGAEEAGASVEKVFLCKRNIYACTGCDSCVKTGQCILDDGMDHLYKKVLSANGLVIAAPIYFNSINAQTKAFIDRFRCIWERKTLLNEEVTDPETRPSRRGLFLSAAGLDNPRAFEGAIKVLDIFFETVDVNYYERLLFFKMNHKGAVQRHPTALADAHRAGGHLVEEISRHFASLEG